MMDDDGDEVAKERMNKMLEDLRRQLKESQEESYARSMALEQERELMGSELRAMSKHLQVRTGTDSIDVMVTAFVSLTNV